MARLCVVRAKEEEGSSTSRCEEDRMMWRGIWNLNIKKKVQYFLWRACHNRLPVGTNLKKRGIELDEMCKLCGEEKETAEHVFFHCPTAQLIWKLAPVRWEGVDQQITSVQDWWRDLTTAGNMKELDDRKEFSVYMLWHIWKHRNRWTFQSEKWTEMEVVRGAWNEWLEFKEEQLKVLQNRIWQVTMDRKESWKAPELGAVKLNVGVVFNILLHG